MSATGKVPSKHVKVSGDQAKELARALGITLPASGEMSVFHPAEGADAADHLGDFASVLKHKNEFRVLIVPQCW